MRNTPNFYLIIVFLFISTDGFGQFDCCTETGRPEPGRAYLDALSLCFLDSEIECFSMRSPNTSGPILGCSSHQLENPHTYIIFPIDDTFQLRIEPTNCINTNGIQVMLYRLTSTPYVDDCLNLNPQLNSEQLFCAGTTNAIEFTQTNAKDEIYHLYIDGLNGDICDYTIESIRGAYRNAPRDSLSLSGPSGLPIGYTATYTAEQFSFDCFENYHCNCGECNLDTFGVQWTGPPGSLINPIPGTLSAEVTMGSQNGSVCIRVKDDCENLFRCIQVEVTPTEFYEKCPNDFTFAHGEVYGDAGVYYPTEDGKIYEVVVEEYIEKIEVEFIHGCIGQEFQDCIANTITYPQTDNICSIIENDTCKTIQTFITWHAPLDTTIYDTICYGMSSLFCGNNYSASGIYDCINLSQYSCDSNTHLALFILPPDSLFLFDTLCDGDDLSFCGQNIDQAGVFSCSDTTNGCVAFSILHITVDPIDTMVIDTTLCMPDTFIFNGMNFTSAGSYTIEEIDLDGCLDRFIINLMYDQVDTTFITDTVCQMQSYDFCGMSITDPGVYYCSYETSSVCDSIVELTLISPCRGVGYILLCPNEELVYPDTTINSPGTYFIANTYSTTCTCIDTLTVEYADLGSSRIIASSLFTCDNDQIDLFIQLDSLLPISILGTEWFFNNQSISNNSLIQVNTAGEYKVNLSYLNLFNQICNDTLIYMVDASDDFNPMLNWIDRALVICDSNLSPYHLAFESDAPYSALTLVNTNEEWINQNHIDIDLPASDDNFNFRLILQSENGDCEEIVEFSVNKLSIPTIWPDTLYISNIRDVIFLENPLFNLDPPAEKISYSSTQFSNGIDESNLIIHPTVSGPVNLSFSVGACDYMYSSFVVRNSIFVPTAFSPNNDGINDQFTCFTSAGFTLDEMKIYNRWGAQVFSSNIAPIAWNGRSNDKKMPEGVYVVQYTYSDRLENVYNGVSELMLVR